MVINNKDYLTFRDLGFAYCLNECIYNQLGDYNEFINNSFVGSWGKTLVLNGDNTNPKSVKDNYVAYNDFYETGLQGLLKGAQGETVWVASMNNATVKGNILNKPHGVVINYFQSAGGLVENNTITNCNQDSGDYSHGIYFDGGNNSITRYNYVANCTNGYSLNSEQGTNISHNHTAYNNVFDNVEVMAIFDCQNDNTCIIGANFSHNTGVRNIQTVTGYYAMIQAQNTTNLILKDNLLVSTHNDSDPVILHLLNNSLSGLDSDYNNYYSVNSSLYRFSMNGGSLIYTNLSNYSTGQKQDNHSLTLNPYFNSILQPSSGSGICTMASDGTVIGALACFTCSESWVCTEWTSSTSASCTGDYEIRTCTDSSNCGTTIEIPDQSRCLIYTGGGGSSGGGGGASYVVDNSTLSPANNENQEPSVQQPSNDWINKATDYVIGNLKLEGTLLIGLIIGCLLYTSDAADE